MLCALSVDLDEIGHYHAIHGLPPPTASAGAVYSVALGRLVRLARQLDVPLTLFAVGADMAVEGNAARLRAAAAQGHEIGNHSLDHRYDLTLLDPVERRRQVEAGRSVLEGATGQRVEGFRAPGYNASDALLADVAASGHRYDSSVFPCAPYLAARALAIGLLGLRGRRSASIAGDPRAALAPVDPYRMGVPYTTRGAGLVELPIQVTPWARLPVIGTSLLALPEGAGALLIDACGPRPLLNLELHGIDALGEGDGLDALRGSQPDAAIPAAVKLTRLGAAVERLKKRGVGFVTLGEAARGF